jgi:hypothetical protein
MTAPLLLGSLLRAKQKGAPRPAAGSSISSGFPAIWPALSLQGIMPVSRHERLQNGTFGCTLGPRLMPGFPIQEDPPVQATGKTDVIISKRGSMRALKGYFCQLNPTIK